MQDLNPTPGLTPAQRHKQERYRDARITGDYDKIWQSTGKCVFCDLRDKYIFFEENGIVMTVSLYAYIDGNLMIVPRRHVAAAKDLTQSEWDTIRKFLYLAKKIIRKVHGIKGVNYVLRDGGAVANSTVADHLHIHAIPFDAPDLIKWNYRKLKYTPIENAALYQRVHNELLDLDTRFERKYKHYTGLPVLCDAIIINERNEILFQERAEFAKLNPDYITVPGGGVTNYEVPLEQELAREIHEETHHWVQPHQLKLVASRIEILKGRDLTVYPGGKKRVLWNSYVLRGFDSATPMTPGDDAKALLWIPIAEVAQHPRISPEMKATIASLQL
jgi:diadenosine tetraphosphate (Ap4A) HIT family hydrolase/ADP-ribose pyrophosphatase YjhB (NUDIX family)